MSTITPRLDHVVISVAGQLDESLARYRQLGFQLTPRGHHTLGSSNHLAIFGTDYLELLGYEPQNRDRAAERWGPDLDQIGLSGIAFKTDDADADFARFAQAGVTLDGDAPRAFHRPVELPDGSERDARFRTFRIDPSAVANGRLFFCQHLDPDLVWRDTWQTHANGVTSVSQVVLSTPDPVAAVALLASGFGAAAVQAIEGGQRVRVGATNVDYLTPDAIRQQFGSTAIIPDGNGVNLVALGLRTATLAQAAEGWKREGVTGVQEIGGRLIVPADAAYGVALAFEQA